MSGSLMILGCFVLGVLLAWLGWIPDYFLEHDGTLYVLYVLMFLVGISIGHDRRLGEILRTLRPRVLLADEPTAALDVSAQKQVLEELLLVRESFGTAVVLVSHNLGLVAAMADRVLVMRRGEIVEAGETRQVLRQPRADYTRRLLEAVPKLRRA